MELTAIVQTLKGLAELGALDVDAEGKAWVKISAGAGPAYVSLETKVNVKALGKVENEDSLS